MRVVEANKTRAAKIERLELTRRDRAAFVEALLTAAAPIARLRKAAERHARMFAD